jgi:D-glycero-D-manno-heptose 1,7-bisphosphate phosphatase
MLNKAIFLDRDDTLIDDPGYISHPDQVRLLEGVPDALNGFHKLGYKLVVVTNQSGIARGLLTEDTLKTIHAKFEDLLAEKHAYVDRIFYCPYHVEGVIDEYCKASNNRKPNPGMLLQAADDMDIDLSISWCIGNGLSDVEAGQRAGCHTILIDQMSPTGQAKPGQIRPDYIAVNMREALNIVKQFEATEKRHTEKPTPDLNPELEPDPIQEEEHPSVPESKSIEPEPDTEMMPETCVAIEEFLPAQEPAPTPKIKKRRKRKLQLLPPQEQVTPQTATTPQLLQGILDQLKSMQRDDMFDEFSLLRFVAGVAQIGVFVCLLIAVWFLLAPQKAFNPILTTLGFAIVLQVMCLTLTIQGRK